LLAAVLTGCQTVCYYQQAVAGQCQILLHQQSISKLLADPKTPAPLKAKFQTILNIRQFAARQLRLPVGQSYLKYTDLHRPFVVWNVNIAPALSLDPMTWWFPIVGRVSYRGYFHEPPARRYAAHFAKEGWDVYVDGIETYSTLGWFKDPILPSMLDWEEFDLADTILHELTHATLWVKGGVPFNESFASFVGEEGAFRYLEARYGKDSEVYARARWRFEDDEEWHAVLRRLFLDLAAVYTNPSLTDGEKRTRKAALLAELPSRVGATPLHERARFDRAARDGRWNNARLALFKTYHTSRPAFATILRASDGDLLRFIERVRQIAARGDPFTELAREAGIESNPVDPK